MQPPGTAAGERRHRRPSPARLPPRRGAPGPAPSVLRLRRRRGSPFAMPGVLRVRPLDDPVDDAEQEDEPAEEADERRPLVAAVVPRRVMVVTVRGHGPLTPLGAS